MSEKSVGDYNLLKRLGQGALGALYLAEHKYMKKSFALKILPEELASDRGFTARFEKQMQELALLEHPHIVKTHNASFFEGQYFFVTDCIVDETGESTNLYQYLQNRKAPLTEEEAYQILSQVASALSWAHEKRVAEEPLTHLGLKLNNILVEKNSSELKVYLSDFGIARVIGFGPLLSRSYKTVAELLGLHSGIYFGKGGDALKVSKLHQSFLQTYAFLAPEQKQVADPRQHDIKVDLYAFGVLAYYLLFQEFPEGVFEMPSTRRPELKKNWDALILSCLKNSPLKRCASIKEAMLFLGDMAFTSVPGQLHFEGFFDHSKTLKPLLKPQDVVRPEYEPNPGAIFQTDTLIGKYSPKEQEISSSEPIPSDMAVIPAGHYYRGSSKGARDETPRHLVNLTAFAIDVHPVTNEQFVRFLEVMGGEKDVNNSDIIRLKDSRIKRAAGKLCIESGYAKHPVVGITWYGAQAYAKWIGKRLPTEAEWEVAASGKGSDADETLFPNGDNIERSEANFFSSDTTAVMSYPANGYKLYDMAGNVYEWCQDWYGYHYYETSLQEPTDPQGPLQGVYRVLRGGCWKSLKEDLRIAHRHRNNPGTVNGTYGFRCVADVG